MIERGDASGIADTDILYSGNKTRINCCCSSLGCRELSRLNTPPRGRRACAPPYRGGGEACGVVCVRGKKRKRGEIGFWRERYKLLTHPSPPLCHPRSRFFPPSAAVWSMPLCRVLWCVLNKLLSQNTRNNALSRVAHRQQYIFANTLLLYYPLTLHNTNYKPLYLLRHTRNYTRRALL